MRNIKKNYGRNFLIIHKMNTLLRGKNRLFYALVFVEISIDSPRTHALNEHGARALSMRCSIFSNLMECS